MNKNIFLDEAYSHRRQIENLKVLFIRHYPRLRLISGIYNKLLVLFATFNKPLESHHFWKFICGYYNIGTPLTVLALDLETSSGLSIFLSP